MYSKLGGEGIIEEERNVEPVRGKVVSWVLS